jgi:hypothetical protein
LLSFGADMKQLSNALQAHLEGELLTVATCVRVTRSDGVELRITDHDKALLFLGDSFEPSPSFVLSAIKSSSDLSVDNAEITIGMSSDADSRISRQHIERGLFKNASFEVFMVNWSNLSMGRMILKRGTVGDISIENPTQATLQLRGLTQALRRSPVELYSPTCRAGFGSARCGFANMPTRIRLNNGLHRTSDWYMVPFDAVSVPFTNGSFEAAGVLPNTPSGIAGWSYADGSFWKVRNDFGGVDGSYYLEGGDDGQGTATGQPVVLTQSINTSAAGMASSLVDAGSYAAAISLNMANTDIAAKNTGGYVIRQYNAAGVLVSADKSPVKSYKYRVWTTEQTVIYVRPGVRRIELSLLAYKNVGTSATVAFDDIQFRWWENTPEAFGNKMFKVCRFPAYGATELMPLSNAGFDVDGPVANGTTGITGWLYDGSWEVLSTYSGLTAYGGGYFLKGGDNASGVQSTYTLSKTKIINISAPEPLNPYTTAAAIDAAKMGLHLRLRVVRLNAGSSYAITMSYLNVAGAVVGSSTTGLVAGPVGGWSPVLLTGTLPATARAVTVSLSATSPLGDSHAQIGFDSLSLHLLNVGVEALEDPATARLSSSAPSELASLPIGSYAFDGAALVQAHPLIFAVTTVSASLTGGEFEAAGIDKTASSLFGGRVTWLTGNNAGTTSYIRVWDNTTKRIQLYDPLGVVVSVGDKFVYAEGCSKTITDCANRFSNATNFRGEPYLPGTTKVIEFFSDTKA